MSFDPISLISASSGIAVYKLVRPWVERWWRGELEADDFHFIGDKVGLVIGEGNLHALRANPEAHVSTHIKSAAGHFVSAAGALFREKVRYVEEDELIRDRNIAGVFLGGPVANATYREYCGYTLERAPDGQASIPVWTPRGLRWGFFLGLGQWGLTPTNRRLGVDSPCEPLTSLRMRADGTLDPIPKPRYGIVDDTGKITMLEVDGDNRLVEDYVLVTRLERTDAPGRFIIMVAGAHGFATEAFGRDWRVHIGLLREVADRHGPEFQVLIPASIDHSAGTRGVVLNPRAARSAPATGRD